MVRSLESIEFLHCGPFFLAGDRGLVAISRLNSLHLAPSLDSQDRTFTLLCQFFLGEQGYSLGGIRRTTSHFRTGNAVPEYSQSTHCRPSSEGLPLAYEHQNRKHSEDVAVAKGRKNETGQMTLAKKLGLSLGSRMKLRCPGLADLYPDLCK